MLQKRFTLMKTFGMNEFAAKWGQSGAKAWAMYCWAVENEASIWGTGLVRSTDGYVAQEVKAIKARKKK